MNTLKAIISILVSFIFLISCNVKKTNSQFHPPNTRQAVARPDNDFVTFTDTISPRISIPQLVNQKIDTLLKINQKFELLDVFKIKYDENINVYLVKIKGISKVIRYYLLAYHLNHKIVTSEPPYINGRWMENDEIGFHPNRRFLAPPLLYFEDINRNNFPEIAIKIRVHNGTVYNALIHNFYQINDDMNISLIFAFESKQVDLMNQGCLIEREISNNQIDVKLNCPNKPPTLIGKTTINLEKGKFRIQKKEVFHEWYDELLITGSATPENEFLNKGYQSIY